MSESKLRADEIDAIKAQAIAKHQAQAMHAKLMEAPAIFAPSFYLADAAGMVRLIMHEPGANGEPVVRGSFLITTEAILKLAEIAPQFVAKMAEARLASSAAPAPEAKIETIDGPDAVIGTATLAAKPN